MEHSNRGGDDSITPSDFRGHSAHDDRLEMVDCSLHGICILSPLQFAAGERFLAKLRVKQRLVLSVYTSRHCIQENKKYKVGAEFTGFISGVHDDPDQILKALVVESEKP